MLALLLTLVPVALALLPRLTRRLDTADIFLPAKLREDRLVELQTFASALPEGTAARQAVDEAVEAAVTAYLTGFNTMSPERYRALLQLTQARRLTQIYGAVTLGLFVGQILVTDPNVDHAVRILLGLSLAVFAFVFLNCGVFYWRHLALTVSERTDAPTK